MRYQITGVSTSNGLVEPVPTEYQCSKHIMAATIYCDLEHDIPAEAGPTRVSSSYTVFNDGRVMQGQNCVEGWIYCFNWDTFRDYDMGNRVVKKNMSGSVAVATRIADGYKGSTEVQISQVQ